MIRESTLPQLEKGSENFGIGKGAEQQRSAIGLGIIRVGLEFQKQLHHGKLLHGDRQKQRRN